MPEQDGAPGNLFKGPLFAALMVIIGTMTLTVTFYTLAVENLNIKSAKDVREKAKELQAKAKAAAETAKGKLTGRGKKKAFFGDEDDDDDGAAAQVAQAVTPHGDEDRREWGRTSDGKMGWLPRPAHVPTTRCRVIRGGISRWHDVTSRPRRAGRRDSHVRVGLHRSKPALRRPRGENVGQ